ncbi:MAG: 30S ribosomal protein S6 [bacterium]
MNQYEALFILDIQGKDEGVMEASDMIESEIQALGGSVKSSQKMDRHRFENVAGRLDSGYYLGVSFQLPPVKLEALRQKLKLNDKVYRQFYLCSQPISKKKEKAEKVAA